MLIRPLSRLLCWALTRHRVRTRLLDHPAVLTIEPFHPGGGTQGISHYERTCRCGRYGSFLIDEIL